MREMVELTGHELDRLLTILQHSPQQRIRTLRFMIDGSGIKIKINEYAWTAPFGHRRRTE